MISSSKMSGIDDLETKLKLLSKLADRRRETDVEEVDKLCSSLLDKISTAYRSGDEFVAVLHLYNIYTDCEMAKGRAQSVTERLRPDLPKGWTVVCDGGNVVLKFPMVANSKITSDNDPPLYQPS